MSGFPRRVVADATASFSISPQGAVALDPTRDRHPVGAAARVAFDFSAHTGNNRQNKSLPHAPRVLFVDDDIITLDAYRRSLHLARTGKQIDLTPCVHDALMIAEDNPPDIAVLDINMPVMDGVSLAQRLLDIKQDIRVIFLTGSTSHTQAVEAFNAVRPFRYLSKPCTAEQLLATIDEALDGIHGASARPADGDKIPDTAPHTTFSGLNAAVLITDDNGMVITRTDKSSELLARFPEVRAEVNRRFSVSDPMRRDALHRAIRFAAREGEKDVLVWDDAEEGGLAIQIAPFRNKTASDTLVMCRLCDLSIQNLEISSDLLMRQFGLTNSEARLASHMAKGMSLEDAAAACGITKNSARTYLKYIFEKTHVNRQVELVRKIILCTSFIF